MNLIKHIIEHNILGVFANGSGIPSPTDITQRYWAYQDFTPNGSTELTITQNENADTTITVDSGVNVILNSTVASTTSGQPYYKGIPLISNRVSASNSDTSNHRLVTIDKVINSGTIRIWYLIRGIPPKGYKVAPKFINKARAENLEATFVNQFGDIMYGDLDMSGNSLTNLPAPVNDNDAVRNIDLINEAITRQSGDINLQSEIDTLSGDLPLKADKVIDSTLNDIAILNESGNIQDSNVLIGNVELKQESILKNWDFSRADENNRPLNWFGYYTSNENYGSEAGEIVNNYFKIATPFSMNVNYYYFLQQQFLVDNDENANDINFNLSFGAYSNNDTKGKIKIKIIDRKEDASNETIIVDVGTIDITTIESNNNTNNILINIPNSYKGKLLNIQFEFITLGTIQGDTIIYYVSNIKLTNANYNNLKNNLNKEEFGIIKSTESDRIKGFLDEKLEYTTFGNTTIPKTVAQITGTGFKKIQLDPRLTADYIVSNATELQLALDDIANTGIGGKIYLLKGNNYDKGSAFNIPSVANIEITGKGVIKRPDNDHAINVVSTNNNLLNLHINGIRFEGENSDNTQDYSFIHINAPTLKGTKIDNCFFHNNNFDYISGGYTGVEIVNNTFISNNYAHGTPAFISGNERGSDDNTINKISNNIFNSYYQTNGMNYIEFSNNKVIKYLNIENNIFNFYGSKSKSVNNIRSFLYFNNNYNATVGSINFYNNKLYASFHSGNPDGLDYVIFIDNQYADIMNNHYIRTNTDSVKDTNTFTIIIDDDDHYHVSHNTMTPKTV